MYQIKIQRKNIKNIILKIDSNGDISISAPRKISKQILDDFILSKKDWIQERVDRVKLRKDIFPEKNYDFFYFLGNKLPFSYLLNFFNLNLEESDFSQEKKKSLIKTFLEIKSRELIPPLVDKYLSETGFRCQYVSFKFMKTRWGSCNSSKKYLNFNCILSGSPLEANEYVVAHEIAHLKHGNHGKEFYFQLSKILPNHEEKRKKLIFFEL